MAYIVYFKCSTVENMALTTIITSSTMIKNQTQVLRKPSKWFVKSHIAYVFIHRLFFSLSCCCLSWRVFITLTMLKHHFPFDWSSTYSNRIVGRLYDLPLNYGHLTPLSKSYRYSLFLYFSHYFSALIFAIYQSMPAFFCISFLIQFLFEVIGANKTKNMYRVKIIDWTRFRCTGRLFQIEFNKRSIR